MTRRPGIIALEASLTAMGDIVDRARQMKAHDNFGEPLSDTEVSEVLEAVSAHAFEIGKTVEKMRATLGAKPA